MGAVGMETGVAVLREVDCGCGAPRKTTEASGTVGTFMFSISACSRSQALFMSARMAWASAPPCRVPLIIEGCLARPLLLES